MAEQSYLTSCIQCGGSGEICPICDEPFSECDHAEGKDPFEGVECPTCRGTGEHPNGGDS